MPMRRKAVVLLFISKAGPPSVAFTVTTTHHTEAPQHAPHIPDTATPAPTATLLFQATSPMISPLPSVHTVSCFLVFLEKLIPSSKHIKSICVIHSGHIEIPSTRKALCAANLPHRRCLRYSGVLKTGFIRNRWPPSIGIGGRNRPESVAAFPRIRWSESSEYPYGQKIL